VTIHGEGGDSERSEPVKNDIRQRLFCQPDGGLAGATALESVWFAAPHIPWILLPALMNNDAEASAMKVINKVYSMRSWPDSSRRNLCIKHHILSSPLAGALP
jgi:hypothetical protein